MQVPRVDDFVPLGARGSVEVRAQREPAQQQPPLPTWTITPRTCRPSPRRRRSRSDAPGAFRGGGGGRDKGGEGAGGHRETSAGEVAAAATAAESTSSPEAAKIAELQGLIAELDAVQREAPARDPRASSPRMKARRGDRRVGRRRRAVGARPPREISFAPTPSPVRAMRERRGGGGGGRHGTVRRDAGRDDGEGARGGRRHSWRRGFTGSL